MDDAPRIKRLLEQAVEEIEDLRRTNEVLRARVETIDLFALVLHTRPAARAEAVMQARLRAAELADGAARAVALKLRREIAGIERDQQMARDGVPGDE